MKRFIIALALSLSVTPALSATISTGEASSHVGQYATVEGVVGEVKTSKGGTTFIDLDGHYPNEALSGVIFSSDTAAVGDISKLTGKKIDMSGTIQLYRGRPEIIVKSRGQIREVP